MTSRPSTSKPRGVCKYYNAGPRGCLAGNSCKFLHGEEKLTSFDKAKTCRYYAAGFCKRGADCWFRHIMPDARSFPAGLEPPPAITDDVCGICLEQPITFGLLSHCTHAFCLECVKQWRDQKNNQDDPDGEAHRANKRCPYCRTLSSFVIPSSYYYPEGHPGKAAALKRFRESTSRKRCKHFDRSPIADRYCPFGSDCMYKHENADGTPYVFSHGVDHYMPLAARRRTQTFNVPDPLENPFRENLNLFFRDVRAVLGGLYRVAQEGQPGGDIGSEVPTPAATEHLLDVLANELSISQLWQSDESEGSRANSPPALETVAPSSRLTSTTTAQWGSVRDDLAFRARDGDSDADSMPSLEDVSESSDEESDYNSEPDQPDEPALPDATHEPRGDALSLRGADLHVGSGVPATDNAPTATSSTSSTPAAHVHLSASSDIQHADLPPPGESPSNAVPALDGATLAALRADQALDITSPIAGVAAPPSSPSPATLPEPPFMTDGRGRVVWSRAGAKRGPLGSASTSVASDSPVAEQSESPPQASSHDSNTTP